jgi:AbrB family looped-hinge helix DNA binding protein
MAGIRKRIGQNGRLVIPASYRRALGMKPGDALVLVLGDGEVRMLARGTALKQAQALVRRFVPKNRRLSVELIKDRRTEAFRDTV